VRSGADLGRALAEIRRERNMSQEQFSAAAGIERTSLSKFESGRRTSRMLEHVLRGLRRLGATVTISIEETDATP